ncbi:hypothetical protein Ae168Ps1_5576c [Pseudonocardia sp. Ae168_Ps1]|nr:hypothetical protein Ae168Ps1_5576c [Pseudonocardia sp. Ae168_Ps1]
MQPAASAGAQLEGEQQQRGVPRGDRADHPDQLPEGVAEVVRVHRRDGPALDLVGQPREVVVPLRQALELPAHLAQQLPGVVHLQAGQPLGVRRDRVAAPAQDRGPGEARHGAPLPVQCRPRRRDRLVDVVRAAVGELRPRRSGVRVLRLERASRPRADGLPADEQPELVQGCRHRPLLTGPGDLDAAGR